MSSPRVEMQAPMSCLERPNPRFASEFQVENPKIKTWGPTVLTMSFAEPAITVGILLASNVGQPDSRSGGRRVSLAPGYYIYMSCLRRSRNRNSPF
ncbi:MAG: hypothetical protein Ct9H90mP27_4430 [Gammaproteobacteria bacterium]|nr:MAG: hypothetical protein Ct9H90mP27_4430 [Gammaproteobacteria bacterium]